MNEPSVFNGPEVSMQKDAKNLQGIEHREWHNLYGIYMQMATALGLTQRSVGVEPPSALSALWKAVVGASETRSGKSVEDPGQASGAAVVQRPFVLTRAFWAGSQRHGAMWTGDNSASWGHLKIASPMLLSINLAGLSFAGSDVGGFFGEPGAELFTRWYQAGAFTPFFRGHAHHDTKRREPWVFGEPYTSILRTTAMLRYTLLPYWYTTFYAAYATGMPVMRPLFFEFPHDEQTFKVDNQWMIGDSLLVHPVTDAGATSAEVYFPNAGSTNGVNWYALETLAAVATGDGATPAIGKTMRVEAPLSHIPVFIRAGAIIPRKMRLRRSSKLMFFDPLTLVVTPRYERQSQQGGGDNNDGVIAYAHGLLYLDDEFSLAHESHGSYAVRALLYTAKETGSAQITCTAGESKNIPTTGVTESLLRPAVAPRKDFAAPSAVERIQIAAQPRAPQSITLAVLHHAGDAESVVDQQTETSELTFFHDPVTQILTIKKPMAMLTDDWLINIQY